MDKVIEQAAQALAACMDYPWKYMPEQGRQTMRDNARKIIGTALVAERERLSLICEAEHVGRHMHDDELDESDLAYNNAVRDCASAVRRA